MYILLDLGSIKTYSINSVFASVSTSGRKCEVWYLGLDKVASFSLPAMVFIESKSGIRY